MHVIRPAHDMGMRVAHLVLGSILDYVEFEDDFVMIRTSPPLRRPRPAAVYKESHPQGSDVSVPW